MNLAGRDPIGPYGEVLRRAPPFPPWSPGGYSPAPAPHRQASPGGGAAEYSQSPLAHRHASADGSAGASETATRQGDARFGALIRVLEESAGSPAAEGFESSVLKKCGPSPREVSTDASALLLIDPQRSFTSGVWKQSIGANATVEVMPLRQAFKNCAGVLEECGNRVETMFTRCPFPPESYDWDECMRGIIVATQLYFVKPGNSVLWPPSNGFRDWVLNLLGRGKKTLVLGGCTLNSCIRISAIEVERLFGPCGLKVVVDLGLCGARIGNFLPSELFAGASPVESAVDQMLAAGVDLARSVTWI